jgi:hypothetical protein
MFPTVSISISLNDLTNISSWIKKDTNKSLEFHSSESEISLKKFHFPKQLIKETKNKITCGYKLDTHNFEITIAANFLSIATPTMGEIQLFYYFSDNYFFASDSFAHLINLIPQKLLPPLDPEGVVNFLSLDFRLDERTLFSGIKLLRENSKLKINNNKLETSILLDWKEIVTLGSSTYTLDSAVKLFEKRFTESLDSTLNNYQSKIASTLSGGVDSSLISAALINKQGKDTPLYTIAFTEPDRTYQENRINDFVDQFGGELNIIDISKISLIPKNEDSYILDPYINPYVQSTIKLAKQASKNHDHFILNGYGGDELFGQVRKEKVISHQKMQEEENYDFFSNSAKQFLFKEDRASNNKIKSIIPSSTSRALLFSYPGWRSMGIWPHAPLLTSGIISMAYLLPNKLRQHRAVVIEYMKKNNFPKSIFESKNPTHRSFFNKQLSITSDKQKMELVRKSIANEMGVIDLKYIQKKLNQESVDARQEKHMRQLIYGMMRLELFLKSI